MGGRSSLITEIECQVMEQIPFPPFVRLALIAVDLHIALELE